MLARRFDIMKEPKTIACDMVLHSAKIDNTIDQNSAHSKYILTFIFYKPSIFITSGTNLTRCTMTTGTHLSHIYFFTLISRFESIKLT